MCVFIDVWFFHPVIMCAGVTSFSTEALKNYLSLFSLDVFSCSQFWTSHVLRGMVSV